ncbi:MAG: hypothetical protein Q7T78_20720 [Rhodoferax sp.]|nr:hypothetical protein [Rhodoferax sp.]
MQQLFWAFRYLLVFLIVAQINAVSAQSGQPTVNPLQSDLISSWVVTVTDEPRQRSLVIRSIAEGANGSLLLDATYGWLDGKPTQVRGEIAQSGVERRLELVTPADSKIVAKQLTDGSFAGTITSKNGVVKPVKLERLHNAINSGTTALANNAALQTTSPKISSQSIVRHKSGEFDGVWSGFGTVMTGTNCQTNPSIKFAVKEGRILVDGLSHGAYFGSGFSKLYGVIHMDKSVDLTLVDRNGKGRSSQAYGSIDAQSNMALTDLGDNCSYGYKLTKG